MFNNNIIWVTQLISKQDFDTPAAALQNATELITNWCKENGFKYKINHNKDTGKNRILFLETPQKVYVYKFVISVYSKPTGEHEKAYNVFTNSESLREITKPVYRAHLDRDFKA